MFKKVVGRKTTTYNPEGNWYIDIIETDDEFETWIYLKTHGIKSFLWGEPKQQMWGTTTRKNFVDRVKERWTDYADEYIEEFAPDETEY